MLSKLSFMNEFSINQLVTVTETKQIAEMLPGILNQLGPDSLTHLKRLATAAVPDMNADAAADDDDEVQSGSQGIFQETKFGEMKP